MLAIASDKQIWAFEEWFSTNHSVLALMGGNQSGKTYCAGHIMAKEIRDNCLPDTICWCVSPNSELSIKKQQKLLWEILPRDKMGRWSWDAKNGFGSKNPIIIYDERTKDNPTGRNVIVYFKSQSQYENDPDSFESETVTGPVWVDESISEFCYNAIQPRVALFGSPILVSTIPRMDWMYDALEEAPEEAKVCLIKMLPMDNPTMTEDKYDRLAASITSDEEKEMRLFGNFMFFGGIVYKEFVRQYYPDGNLISRQDIPKDLKYFAGLDVGMDHPTAFILLGVDRQNRVYVVDEYYSRHTKISDDVERIKELLMGRSLEWPTIIDPSAYSITKGNELCVGDQYTDLGLTVTPGRNTAKYGERAQVYEIKERLGRQDLLVCDECPNLIRELRVWKYKRDQYGESLAADLFEDKNNDGCDALRYVLSLDPHYSESKIKVETY